MVHTSDRSSFSYFHDLDHSGQIIVHDLYDLYDLAHVDG